MIIFGGCLRRKLTCEYNIILDAFKFVYLELIEKNLHASSWWVHLHSLAMLMQIFKTIWKCC